MDFDQNAPLNRIPNERQKANDALMDYFLMGPGRSLEKLRRNYGGVTAKEPPTIHLRTLEKWSTRHHWQARIAQQTENDNAIALEKYRKRHMTEAEALALLADQARGDMGRLADVRAQTDLANHSQSALVKNITQHYTQTTRGTGETSQAEIKARIVLGLYDAQRALELILKYHGSFAADNKRQNLNVDLSELTDDQLKRLAAGEDIVAILANE